MGDEPGFRASVFTELSFLPSKNNVLVPTYLYNYVGQPTKTVDRVDAMLAMYYNTS
jgi:putative alpha-1,2-mannosidase